MPCQYNDHSLIVSFKHVGVVENNVSGSTLYFSDQLIRLPCFPREAYKGKETLEDSWRPLEAATISA